MSEAASDKPRVVVFACNWEAYRGLEEAGASRWCYPAQIRIVRLPCLARLHSGHVLKAFQAGADGVLLLGCPPDRCHYGVGGDNGEWVFQQSAMLLHLLGIAPSRLALDFVPEGRGDTCAERMQAFVDGLAQPAAPVTPLERG